MPINKDRSDLPPAAGPLSPLPTGQTLIAGPLLTKWWEDYQKSPLFTKDSANPELPLRGSMAGLRCDRQLWYAITDEPKSNPPGVASVWRMRMGQLIHDEIAAGMASNLYNEDGKKHGWWAEDENDLTAIGYPGSSHGDLVYYDDGIPLYVAENKSVGGYAFKLMATRFNGPAEGPRWEHVLQAAMTALAIKAPTIVVFYVAPESVSADVAKSCNLDEYGKFTAEWQYPTSMYADDVTREVARQKRILRQATPFENTTDQWIITRPERVLDHPDIPAGAYVDNPAAGRWVLLSARDGSVVKSGSKWFCGYCDWRDRCIEHGPEMQPIEVKVEVTKK